MKNIAFVIGHLSHGGAEKQLYLLCKGINRKKYNPTVLCLSKSNRPWGDRITSLGIKVIYLIRLSSYDFSRVLRLAFLFYIYKVDIIVSSLHIGNLYSYLARLLYLRKSGHITQIRSKESSMKGLTKWLNILALSSSDCIVTNSTHLVNFVKDFFHQNTDKIHAIYNGIEHLEKVKKSNNTDVHIGIIGKDTKDKNIQLFIDVGIDLLINHENLSFHLCGRELGVTNRFLLNIPEKLRSKFRFYGEFEDISKFLGKLDIYLSTSNSEGLPNTIMEPMSMGLPVIATDVGGVSELVQRGETGYLAPSGDLEGLTEYCKKLIEDVELRRRMGERGRQYIFANFSAEKMAREYEEIFDNFSTIY